jgi:hypothetical protein
MPTGHRGALGSEHRGTTLAVWRGRTIIIVDPVIGSVPFKRR